MRKIFKKLSRYPRAAINILVRLILAVAYFILLFPFAVFIKLFTDFLEIKPRAPSWTPHNKIEDIKKFLSHQ